MPCDAFTPTQRKMLDVLADGRPHTPHELHALLPDDLGSLTNIRAHLSHIRKILRPRGEDILCVIFNRTVHYRWVRLLPGTIEQQQQGVGS